MNTAELNSLKYSLIEELVSMDNKEMLNKVAAYIKEMKLASSVKEKRNEFKKELKAELREAMQEVENSSSDSETTMEELYAILEEA